MVEATLDKQYYSLDEPSALSGINRLYTAARKLHPQLLRSDVEKWLEKQDTYTLHKPARRKLRAEPRVFVKHIDDQWCIDLCEMGNIARFNDGQRYILTCIDVLSKYAWAVPVKSKNGTSVKDAFGEILHSTERRPKRVESDKGKEFYNAPFQGLLHEHGIAHFSSNSRHKSSVVERFNRTLKNLLYKHFAAGNTHKWINTLDKVLGVYNNRYHRSIKTSPAKVSRHNEAIIHRVLYNRKPKPGRLLRVDQLVRISKVKRIFEKGYLPNYTEEVFKICKVHDKRAPLRYELEDLLGEKIEGKFVSDELSPVRKDETDMWKIEKVLKRDRNGRYLVKWYGFPEKFNSWVDEIQVQQ
jgi:transposase InsO family protein